MGLYRTFCMFIVVEQIILGNILVSRSIDSFLKHEYNTYAWIQLFLSLLEALVACMLVLGILQRKPSKFILWLIVNAFICLVFTVTNAVIYFDSSILSTIFGYAHSSLYIILTVFLILQWVAWLTVFKYYRYLKLKDMKCGLVSNKYNISQTKQATTNCNVENKLQSQTPILKERHVSQNKEENIPLYRIYPMPSAPPDI